MSSSDHWPHLFLRVYFLRLTLDRHSRGRLVAIQCITILPTRRYIYGTRSYLTTETCRSNIVTKVSRQHLPHLAKSFPGASHLATSIVIRLDLFHSEHEDASNVTDSLVYDVHIGVDMGRQNMSFAARAISERARLEKKVLSLQSWPFCRMPGWKSLRSSALRPIWSGPISNSDSPILLGVIHLFFRSVVRYHMSVCRSIGGSSNGVPHKSSGQQNVQRFLREKVRHVSAQIFVVCGILGFALLPGHLLSNIAILAFFSNDRLGFSDDSGNHVVQTIGILLVTLPPGLPRMSADPCVFWIINLRG